MKAVIIALKEFPALDSTFKNENVVLFPDINICIAITVSDRLVVPAMRNVDTKRLSGILRG